MRLVAIILDSAATNCHLFQEALPELPGLPRLPS